MALRGAINLSMKRYSYAIAPDQEALLFAALHDRAGSLWLDSADRAHQLARYSFIAFDPYETLESRNGQTVIKGRNGIFILSGEPFTILQDRLATIAPDLADDPALPPFQGGAAGYLGYDLARGLEKLPARAQAHPYMPDMLVGLYDKLCAYDHQRGKAWFIVLADDEQKARHEYEKLRALPLSAPPAYDSSAAPQWSPRETADQYCAKVQRVIDYIHAGDIFQANLSQQFTAPLPPGFDSFAHYCRLRTVNPAPFAAYMNGGRVRISSASPERFLSLRGRDVDTRPIKGTRPRRSDPAADTGMRAALAASEKDRAENAMIVDLLRNDISKVCDDHSVNVPQLCAVESFAAVHHLVSVVTGQLRADKDATDLLRACFPGGSITGAPKIRAMEIIEELEPVRRGPYCGSLFYIGSGGAMDSNIVIRTIIYDGEQATINVGGGIVADSDPAAEYQETLDKGRALFRSFTDEHNAPAAATAPQKAGL